MFYMAIGGSVVYGPQTNLHLIPLSLLGALFSTFVWVSIVLFLGTAFKSSLIAALGALGIWLGTNITGQILGALAGQGWILTYILGVGSTGYVGGRPEVGIPVSTGTDSIGPNLINYILHPSWDVTYYKLNLSGSPPYSWDQLYSEPLSTVISTSIIVALVYFIAFVAISWYLFRRAQVAE
jgi:ABC-type transport system involved in multi-copper enzyme maturation permease subunit